MPTNGKHSWYESLKRLVQYRLFIPLKRSKHPAEHSARGVAVGMFWAMTPFFGLQMTLVLISWVVSTRVFKWDFALIPGIAWTWITNIFTLPPFFYAFYLTGQLVLGRLGTGQGYQIFLDLFDPSKADPNLGYWEQMFRSVTVMFSEIGLPLCIGSLIWAILWAWASYYLTIRFVNQYRAKRGINSDMNNAVS